MAERRCPSIEFGKTGLGLEQTVLTIEVFRSERLRELEM
jgi:hypothetical protein